MRFVLSRFRFLGEMFLNGDGSFGQVRNLYHTTRQYRLASNGGGGRETDSILEITNERQRSRLTKILSNDDSEQFDLLGVWSESVSWNDPSSLSEMSSDSEFVESPFGILLQSPGDERETISATVGEDLEQVAVVDLLDFVGESIGDFRQRGHNSSIATLPESEELVVLSDDLRSTFAEVESDARLRRTEVIEREDDFVREMFLSSPDAPSDTGVDESIFVTTGVNRDDGRKSEIPDEIWIDDCEG